MKADAFRPGRLAVDGRARQERDGVPVVNRKGRAVIASAAGALAVATAVFVFVGALNSKSVSVRHFEVTGNAYMTDEEAVELTGIEAGAGIFSLDLGGAGRALRNDSRVLNASVGRRFPDKVVIEIEERRAVGSIIVDDKLYKIAGDGVITGELASEYEDLPLICGLAVKPGDGDVVGTRITGRELGNALDVLVALRAAPGLYTEVDYVRADEGWFAVAGGNTKVVYGPGFDARAAERVWRVYRILEPGGRFINTIDARFDGDIIVRESVAAGAPADGGDTDGGEG
ncbi:MAG: FtsQ-type POTRA domain-containing protein [Candidatus Coatesbacteria bacterium]|nr:MAG: FtsQ-type POTRA domain-containing protein [Candidatus Coatesbacteria bacterium]